MMELPTAPESHWSTLEVAHQLGMAVRSVQLMVDRGELEAWKTPGGHRRISRLSVELWIAQRRTGPAAPTPALVRTLVSGQATPIVAIAHPASSAAATSAAEAVLQKQAQTKLHTAVRLLSENAAKASQAQPQTRPDRGCVLVIEDSKHYQNLLSLLLREHFPQLDVKLADDGIAGLALVGQLRPRVLIVDILLPGIDGATLIMSLRSHPQFATSGLIVITSLDDADLDRYRFALDGVTVVQKSRVVAELPQHLRRLLDAVPWNGDLLLRRHGDR